MHTSKDDYLISTLRFVFAKEESQIYGARLPKSMISPSPKEPIKKLERVKRPAKKSSDAPIGGVAIRETSVKSLSKKKEKMTDEDDSNNEHDSRSEGSDQERDSVDDYTQSDSEKRLDSEHETDENESGSESDQEENEEDVKDDEEEKDDKLVKTLSNDTGDEDETKIKDKYEGDEHEGMDYTTNQFDDDVNVSLNKPVDTDKGFIQKEGTNAEMINVQQGNENLEISQFIEDAHVTLSTISQKTEVPVTISSHSSDFASKFLKFSDIPYTDAEIVFPMDVLVHHESSYEAASLLIEFELKKILIDKIDESQSYLTAPEHRECYDGLIKSYDLDKSLFSTYDKVYSLKRSQKDKDKDEDPSAGSDRGLKKRKTSKDAEPTKGPKAKESQSGSSKGTKSQSKSSGKSVQSEEPEFENEGKTPQQGPTQSLLMTLASSVAKPSKTFDELMSSPIDFSAYIMNDLKITNLTQETLLRPTFKLLKGTRSNYVEFMNGNHQMVSVDYFFNNNLKYLQGGISTMTYTTSITKKKVAQYDLQGIEDMVPNMWNPVKVAYDKYALWGISYWRQQLTRVEEGDFPRLHINDIEDMLLLIVQNRLTNSSGDDVFNFAIALRMFTRSTRRWSTLEKKRANIMIKAIDKQLKERRMMRSLKKFVGGRHYGCDLRLLQRTI
ncbi:hypothetical protein Tco_0408573 [Tanacetum coccineum]